LIPIVNIFSAVSKVNPEFIGTCISLAYFELPLSKLQWNGQDGDQTAEFGFKTINSLIFYCWYLWYAWISTSWSAVQLFMWIHFDWRMLGI